MSTRAIGSALRTAQDTVRRDLSAGERNRSPAPVAGLDGRRYATDATGAAIGSALGVHQRTVRRAGAANAAPAPVTGLDGKRYAPALPAPAVSSAARNRSPVPNAERSRRH